jgi:hypothetical protein
LSAFKFETTVVEVTTNGDVPDAIVDVILRELKSPLVSRRTIVLALFDVLAVVTLFGIVPKLILDAFRELSNAPLAEMYCDVMTFAENDPLASRRTIVLELF